MSRTAGAISPRRTEDGTDRGLRKHGGGACPGIERRIGVPTLRPGLSSPAQPISEAAGRPSRSWPGGQDRAVVPTPPVQHVPLPDEGLRGAAPPVDNAAARAADLAVAGTGPPSRPGVGRTTSARSSLISGRSWRSCSPPSSAQSEPTVLPHPVLPPPDRIVQAELGSPKGER